MRTDKTVLFDHNTLAVGLGIDDHNTQTEIYTEFLHSLAGLERVLESSEVEPKAIRIELHKLKSSAALVGAHLLAADLAHLERRVVEAGTLLPADSLAHTKVLLQQTRQSIKRHLQVLHRDLASRRTAVD